MQPGRFVTHSLRDPRLLRILCAALDAVEPNAAVRRYFESNPIMANRVYGLAIGKAAIPMMDALAGLVSLSGGLAVSKHASGLSRNRYTLMEGGHPIPDPRSLAAGRAVLDFVSSLNEDDTLVCLISGGGSALVTAPYEGISLEDMQTLTSLLLSCGARIDEINTLRRQLDRVKGGGLASASKARITSLILSDVIGNPLEAIASGPTAPDPTTSEDALRILEKYFPGSTTETRRHGDPSSFDPVTRCLRGSKRNLPNAYAFSHVQNIIIGDNKLAVQAALEQAGREGFHTELLTTELQGEAGEVGRALARQLRKAMGTRLRPFCLMAGGETTVTLRGTGKGGRNQELALAAVPELDGLPDALLIAFATDGEDGPTDAAGAVVAGESARRAGSLGLDAADHLSRNNAYSFFEALGDLIKSGPTGTNVNDLVFLIGL